MNKKRKHHTIERLQNVHGVAVKRLCDRYRSQYTPPPAPVLEWKPENPEITWPKMKNETRLTKDEWLKTNFPFHPLPHQVQGVVKVEVWKKKIHELL